MKRRILIGSLVIAVVIGGVGLWYGLQSQYFGKNLGSHICFVVVAIAGLSAMFALSQWYRSKLDD